MKLAHLHSQHWHKATCLCSVNHLQIHTYTHSLVQALRTHTLRSYRGDAFIGISHLCNGLWWCLKKPNKRSGKQALQTECYHSKRIKKQNEEGSDKMVRFSDGSVRSRGSRWSSVCFPLSPRCFAPSGRPVKERISSALKLTEAILTDPELSEAFLNLAEKVMELLSREEIPHRSNALTRVCFQSILK